MLSQTCRECGCNDYDACWDEDTNLPCHWEESDLCSVCAKTVQGEVEE